MRAAIAAAAIACAANVAWAGSTVKATNAAISTATPQATNAGLDVLRSGGNAIDAAVAVSFALAVSHPQAGNVGGGGFLLFYEAETKATWALDFRETAPGAAQRDMYLLPDGKISPDSRTGPRSAAVPGTVAGLAAAHARFGSMQWKELVAPAIALARDGIIVDAELSRGLESERNERKIDQYSATAALFYPDGEALKSGTKLIQQDLATTLERIAAGGSEEFYRGETAKRMIDAVRAAGGIIGDRDLREYQPVWRAPLRVRFRDYELFTMPPPSGGGLVLAESLNILAGFDLPKAGFQTPLAIHLQAEATRRAYIDRNRVIGDPAATRIPFADLLSSSRAADWRRSIDAHKATPTASLAGSATASTEGTHTTHFTIADAQGNIVSMTTTLNESFGSGFVVPGLGFLLNNEMDDFAPAPGKPNRSGLVYSNANAIDPGKRMASSMTPTIIFRASRPYLALGTRGGPTIPTTILQVFLNMAIYGKSVADAIAAPRFHHQDLPERLEYERGYDKQPVIQSLNAMGHGVEARAPIGDVHAIAFSAGEMIAVADPRRGGSAGGF
ncbi:MAG TPA: gamma-glutamyltransferase [Thermoanaerobaculia bacterium]